MWYLFEGSLAPKIPKNTQIFPLEYNIKNVNVDECLVQFNM